MKQTYTPEELDLRNIAASSPELPRDKFEVLKSMAIHGEALAPHEKYFFCMCIVSSKLNDGSLYDYPCCDDYLFQRNYLTYFKSLSGGIPFYKPQSVDGRPTYVEVALVEVQRDRAYLKDKAREWELVVNMQNHKEQLLQQAAAEGRYALKQIDNLPEIKFLPYSKGTRLYQYKRISALLQSKYIYLMAHEILRETDSSYLSIELAENQIEVNEYSLIHILNRHFAPTAKAYDQDKTFHGPDILFRKLPTQLYEILKQINDSGIFAGRPIGKIHFRFNDIPYLIYTGPANRSIMGIKETFTRLHTFFPIGDPKILQDLENNFDLHAINDQCSVYLQKQA